MSLKSKISGSARRPAPCGPATAPAPVWATLPGAWRVLFGDFGKAGVSVEWHDFSLGEAMPWSCSFNPDSLELCLNLSGRGAIRSPRGELEIGAQTAGFYAPGRGVLEAWRRPGGLIAS